MKSKLIIISFLLFGFIASSYYSGPINNNPKPNIEWDKTSHDFGKIPQNIPVTITFEFKNVGITPVIINSVKAQCGCTATDYTNEPIKPGKKGSISGKFDARKIGYFGKTITVKFEGSDEDVVLTLKGTVEAKK